MNQKLILILVISTLTSSLVTGKTLDSHRRTLLRREKQIQNHEISEFSDSFNWQSAGQMVGVFLVNFVSDDTFQLLTSVLSMGNDLLRTTDEYLDITEALLSGAMGVFRAFGMGDQRRARQLMEVDPAMQLLAGLSGRQMGDIMETINMVSGALGNSQDRQDTVFTSLASMTRRLNEIVGNIRDATAQAAIILQRVAEVTNSSRSEGNARQIEATFGSLSDFVSGASTSVSMLVGDFGRDGGQLLGAISKTLEDLDSNLNATYHAGTIRIGQTTVNVFDFLGPAWREVARAIVEASGMQRAQQRFGVLVEDLSQVQQVTLTYQSRMSSHLSVFTGAVSAAQTSTSQSQMDSVMSSLSHLMRSLAGIVQDTGAFAEDLTNILSRAFDDMHRLESEFTRAWIKWFPEEWGFDGDLSGYYNAGRLFAALSRQLAEFQGTVGDIAESIRMGSTFMDDAASLAGAIDPAAMEGVRRLFG